MNSKQITKGICEYDKKKTYTVELLSISLGVYKWLLWKMKRLLRCTDCI